MINIFIKDHLTHIETDYPYLNEMVWEANKSSFGFELRIGSHVTIYRNIDIVFDLYRYSDLFTINYQSNIQHEPTSQKH